MPRHGSRWLWSNDELDRAVAFLAQATAQPRPRVAYGDVVEDPPGIFLVAEIQRAAQAVTGSTHRNMGNSLRDALIYRGRLDVAEGRLYPRRTTYRLRGLP